MANLKITTDYKQYATVNAAPGGTGFFTDELNLREKEQKVVYFSVAGTGTMTVVLQFKRTGDASWTDYATTSNNGRAALKGGGAGIQWRAGVKNGDYISGEKIMGFDW